MILYFGHSTNYNYKAYLYDPIKASDLYRNHNIIFPHLNDEFADTKLIFKKGCDMFIAEVSLPSIGLGMELGWADCFKVPILCIYRYKSKLSSSLTAITSNFVGYDNSIDMVYKIEYFLREFQNRYHMNNKYNNNCGLTNRSSGFARSPLRSDPANR